MAVHKVLAQLESAATTAETLYTVPAATIAKLTRINLANITASDITVRLAIRPAGATLANKHYLLYGATIPANDALSLSLDGVYLQKTDVVTVYASGANALCSTLWGSEGAER